MFDLRLQMEATGLYSDNDPVSRGELRAYERQLNDFLAWQQQMKHELALDTTVLLISRWEKIYDEMPLPADLIRDRQIRLLNKQRAKGVLTPAKVIAFASDFGYQATVIKRVRPFRYRVQIQKKDVMDLVKLRSILTRSEPGHQNHEFGVIQDAGQVEYGTNLTAPIVVVSSYQVCGTFSSGGEYEL